MSDKIKEVKFFCPVCRETRLECVEKDVCVTSVISSLSDDGDFDWEPSTIEYGDVDRFQCVGCGYTLKKDYQGNYVDKNIEVVEWCKKNCKQD